MWKFTWNRRISNHDKVSSISTTVWKIHLSLIVIPAGIITTHITDYLPWLLLHLSYIIERFFLLSCRRTLTPRNYPFFSAFFCVFTGFACYALNRFSSLLFALVYSLQLCPAQIIPSERTPYLRRMSQWSNCSFSDRLRKKILQRHTYLVVNIVSLPR